MNHPQPPCARIAIVGSGPAAFYTAEAVLEAWPNCRIDMFERLHAPHGLVRYGVAPDHQKLKQASLVFDRIADDPRFDFHAMVEIGRDVTMSRLRASFHAVVIATGRSLDRQFGIPGEALDQVFSASRFVGWYNGHPDHRGLAPDLAVSEVAIFGNGNVALDVCRLLTCDYENIRTSDIAQPMQPFFARRGVRTVHVVGRSGVAATKFSFKEFRQLTQLPGVRLCVPQATEWPEEAWAGPVNDDAARVAEWFREHACNPAAAHQDASITVNFWFHAAPSAFIGVNGKLKQVTLQPSSPAKAALFGSAPTQMNTGLVVTCIGYSAAPLEGLPLDEAGNVQHEHGQVLNPCGEPINGLFVSGWIKRGPTGIIGTNRADGRETAETLIAQLPALLAAHGDLSTTTDAITHKPGTLSYAQWLQLDRHERTCGAALGKPREKLLCADDALAALR